MLYIVNRICAETSANRLLYGKVEKSAAMQVKKRISAQAYVSMTY